jgi:hypothetical protein
MKNGFVLSGILISLLLIGFSPAFSQQPAAEEPAASTPAEPEMQWIWGEAVSVDAASSSIKVKYLDYESDTEKEIAITVDNKTTYENAKSLEEIKAKDTVSIDYLVSPGGQNLAKNISVEKPEDNSVDNEKVPAAAEEITEPAAASEAAE